MIRMTFCALLLSLVCSSLYAADYYWIGGPGDWSDISHWATTSGGSTFHNQAPTANDNVFFDGNSFNGGGQTVTVNTDIIFCRNMNWTGAVGNPVFLGTANRTLNVYGSIVLNVNMDFNFVGDIRLLSLEAGNTINPNGQVLGRSLTFEGDGGEWTLQNELLVDSLINLRNGTVRTGGQDITTKYLDIQIQNNGTLDLGTSKLTLTGRAFGTPYAFVTVLFIQSGNFTLQASDSELEFTSDEAIAGLFNIPNLDFGQVVFSAPDGKSEIRTDVNTALSMRSLRFANSARVSHGLDVGTLTLSAGKAYTFASGATYTVGSLIALGECEAPIQIFGSVSGTPTTFSSATGPIDVGYVSMKDIHAIGGANFEAVNSADLGNNDGWTINATAQNNLFWVGGTGDWSDSNHWSFTSGGPGGACIPTGADNVFFDGNSFTAMGDSVRIDVDNALCQNMDWTGATARPVFDGPLETFSVFMALCD